MEWVLAICLLLVWFIVIQFSNWLMKPRRAKGGVVYCDVYLTKDQHELLTRIIQDIEDRDSSLMADENYERMKNAVVNPWQVRR